MGERTASASVIEAYRDIERSQVALAALLRDPKNANVADADLARKTKMPATHVKRLREEWRRLGFIE